MDIIDKHVPFKLAEECNGVGVITKPSRHGNLRKVHHRTILELCVLYANCMGCTGRFLSAECVQIVGKHLLVKQTLNDVGGLLKATCLVDVKQTARPLVRVARATRTLCKLPSAYLESLLSFSRFLYY